MLIAGIVLLVVLFSLDFALHVLLIRAVRTLSQDLMTLAGDMDEAQAHVNRRLDETTRLTIAMQPPGARPPGLPTWPE